MQLTSSLSLLMVLVAIHNVYAQTDPIIINWYKCNGTGYGNILANVTKIQYSTNYVYVSVNSIPGYTIGPTWTSNPNTPKAQGFLFKFPRNPTVPTTKTDTPLGHIGIWLSGVSIYNADDGQSYNNKGVWKRNAYVWEGVSFDACKGHADQSGEYHHHVSPKCQYNYTNSNVHSPLLGFAFDGYPIYGPYGYSSANNSGSAIKKLVSGYRTRSSMTTRTTLSNGTVLAPANYGPDVNSTYPLGSYIQDYEFSSSGADLDVHNGRYCKTPEYPNGTYAYFVNTDSSGEGVYPFVAGTSFYGSPVMENMGPNSGKTAVSDVTTTYFSYNKAQSLDFSKSFLVFSILFSSIYRIF